MLFTVVLGVGAAVAGICAHPSKRDLCQHVFDEANATAARYPPWQIAVASILTYIVFAGLLEFLFGHEESLFRRIKRAIFQTARAIPFVQSKIDKEVNKALADIEHSFMKHAPSRKKFAVLPATGVPVKELEQLLDATQEAGDPEQRRRSGKLSGTIYVGGDNFEEYTKLLTSAYGKFAWTNPLHTNVFPGVRLMEAEIISMCVDIFHGGEDACGVHTSGGTESIIMAVKAYRDYYREKRGIVKPNIVASRTAHPALDKGCQYFGVALRKVDEDKVTRRANVKALAAHIDGNTIALYGSAPQYPHGCMDPIVEMGELALKNGIGLHIDACLGSFVVPFIKEAGFPFPDFDFQVPGVTSISADTHKFGFAPKGSSVLLYARKDLRRAQYAVFPDWPGGVYGTPCMSGSRPGALVAATWTALMYHGRKGYVDNARAIMETVQKIAKGLKQIPGIKLMCEPEGPIVAWTSDVFDINRMCEGLMEQRKYDINVLQFPPSLHLCVTRNHTLPGVAEQFLKDLKEVTEPLVKTPEVKVQGAGAMYGMSQQIPDRTIIEDIVRGFLDVSYQVDSKYAKKADKNHH